MAKPKQPHPGRQKTSDPIPRPTPEDPREQEPVRDSPIYPDHDDVDLEEVRQAHRDRGVEAPDPWPDSILFDTEDGSIER